jgi:small redox-active disulfide protein 1
LGAQKVLYNNRAILGVIRFPERGVRFVKIELFYNPTCTVCPRAKKLVKKVLKKYHDVEYVEINAFENQDRVLELGFQRVPTIVIDGKVWHSGMPDKTALKKEIASNLG